MIFYSKLVKDYLRFRCPDKYSDTQCSVILSFISKSSIISLSSVHYVLFDIPVVRFKSIMSTFMASLVINVILMIDGYDHEKN